MNSKMIALLATVVSMSIATPAMAAPHFFNANQSVSVVGIGEINGTECVATISGVVGPSLGLPSPHVDHSDRIIASIGNSGPGACTLATFDVVLFADGSMDLSGNSFINGACGVSSVPVHYGSGTVTIVSGTTVSASVTYGGCSLALVASDSGLGYHS